MNKNKIVVIIKQRQPNCPGFLSHLAPVFRVNRRVVTVDKLFSISTVVNYSFADKCLWTQFVNVTDRSGMCRFNRDKKNGLDKTDRECQRFNDRYSSIRVLMFSAINFVGQLGGYSNFDVGPPY